MALTDPNQIAAKVLRQALRNHIGWEQRWKSAYFRSWREAKSEVKHLPKGIRLRDRKLSPHQLNQLGELPIIDP